MQLGLSTYTFPWNILLSNRLHSFGFREMLKVTADNNIRFFQICDNYPLHQLTKNELTELKKSAIGKKIHLQIGTRGLYFDHIVCYLFLAEQLNSPFVRVVIDDLNYHPSEAEIVQIIQALLPLLKEKGIVLAIENHDRFKARILSDIIRQTSAEWVAICLDTVNSFGAAESINEIAPVLLPYTINLHIKDFTVARVQHKMGFTVSGVAAGKGMLDVPALLNECSKYERCSTATLEIWMDEEPLPEQTKAKELSLVTESITYLKKYIL